eukprot:Pgem_evm2s16029
MLFSKSLLSLTILVCGGINAAKGDITMSRSSQNNFVKLAYANPDKQIQHLNNDDAKNTFTNPLIRADDLGAIILRDEDINTSESIASSNLTALEEAMDQMQSVIKMTQHLQHLLNVPVYSSRTLNHIRSLGHSIDNYQQLAESAITDSDAVSKARRSTTVSLRKKNSNRKQTENNRKKRSMHYGPHTVGVIQLDYIYEIGLGDVDHPRTFETINVFPKFKRIEGHTFAMAQAGYIDDNITQKFQAAVDEFEEAGVGMITERYTCLYV